MSAFVMLDEGFNQLFNELAVRAESSNKTCDVHYSITQNVRKFLQLGWDTPTEDRVNANGTGRVIEMFTANVNAVNQRYAHMSEDERGAYSLPLLRRVSYWPQWTPMQLFKHLQCLSYQMSEGDVPEAPIYAALSTLINDIAVSLATHTIEYSTAKWDFEPIKRVA